ncbi:MAG: hypothetical protein AB7Q17_16330 [Phycisphaerae bacterium]
MRIAFALLLAVVGVLGTGCPDMACGPHPSPHLTPGAGDPSDSTDDAAGDPADIPGTNAPDDTPGDALPACTGGRGVVEHSFGGSSLGIDEGLAASITDSWIMIQRFCFQPDPADPGRAVGVVRRSASSSRTAFRFDALSCRSRVTLVDEVSDEVALTGTIERRADGCFVTLTAAPATYTPTARTTCPAEPSEPTTTAPAFPVTLQFDLSFLLPDHGVVDERRSMGSDPIERTSTFVEPVPTGVALPCIPLAP